MDLNTRTILAVIAFMMLALSYATHSKIVARMIAQLERESPRNYQWPTGPQILQRRERAIAREYRAAHPRGALYGYWMITNVVGVLSLVTWIAIAVTLPE